MYDPTVGEFISEDPIGFEAGDANVRRYVGNSPTNATDPSGMVVIPRINDMDSSSSYGTIWEVNDINSSVPYGTFTVVSPWASRRPDSDVKPAPRAPLRSQPEIRRDEYGRRQVVIRWGAINTPKKSVITDTTDADIANKGGMFDDFAQGRGYFDLTSQNADDFVTELARVLMKLPPDLKDNQGRLNVPLVIVRDGHNVAGLGGGETFSPSYAVGRQNSIIWFVLWT